MNNIKKVFAGAIFVLLGLFMITSPSLNLIYAADEQGSSGGSNDGGGDSGKDGGGGGGDDGGGNDGNEDNSGDNSGDNSNQEQDEGQSQSQEEEQEQKPDKPDSGKPEDNEVDDGSKGTPQEQEQAAIDDYVYEEPGIVKPYPPAPKISDKPKPGSIVHPKLNLLCSHTEEGCDKKPTGQGQSQRQEETGKNDPCNYYGRDICEGSPDGKSCNDQKFDCLSDIKGGNYCTTGKCPGDDQPFDCKKSPHKCKPDSGKPWKGGDGKDGNDWKDHNNWCKWHHCNDRHNHHKHNHHNDHHNYNSKNYYYYYTNDYSDNHATVILQPDYSHTNNYHDIRLVIGDQNSFDTVINFAGKPESLVVTGLDLDEGEEFDTCMKNLNDGDSTCVTSTLHDEDKAVYVDIRVP